MIDAKKEKLISGGVWSLGGKLLSVLLGVLINATLARVLTPNDMGAYFLAVSLVGVSVSVALLGFNQTATRLVSQSLALENPGRAGQVVVQTFWGVATGVVVCAALWWGYGEWFVATVFHSSALDKGVRWIGLWLAVLALLSWAAECFRGLHDIRRAVWFAGLTTNLIAITLLTGGWLLWGRIDLPSAILVMVAANLVSVLWAGWLLREKVARLGRAANSALPIKKLLSIALPLWLTALAIVLVNQTNIWILGIYRPASEIAEFGAASRLILLVTMPLLIINAVVPPLIAQWHAQGKLHEMEAVMRGMATLAGIPALFVLLVFLGAAEEVMRLIYGEYYRAAAPFLVILGLGQMVNVWAGSCGLALTMSKHQNLMMLITMVSGTLTILLSIALCKTYGTIGVAVASALGVALQNIFMWSAVRWRLGIWTHMGFISPGYLWALLRKIN